MQAIAVRDRDADLAGLSRTPYPQAAENGVIVRELATTASKTDPALPITDDSANRASRRIHPTPSLTGANTRCRD